jgi:drug/metabolite transporter (DMT)-like permease
MRLGSSQAWSHHALLSLFVWLWGANFVLAEVALREMAPISFSVTRFLTGGIALAVLFRAQNSLGRSKLPDDQRLFPSLRSGDWPRLLAVSVLGATLAPWLGIEGLNETHGARASLWLALGPVLSSGLGLFWGTERIGVTGYLGIALAGIGTFVLAADGLRPGHIYWFGDLLLFTALLMTVAELHLIKPLVNRYGSIPTVVMRTAIGGCLYALIASPELMAESWLRLSAWAWIAILLGGGLGVGVGQWVKVRALNTLGPTRVVLYGNLVPVATLVLAWVTIGTNPSGFEVIAAVLIVLGAVCLQVLDPHAAGTPAAESAAAETSAELTSS